MSVQKALELMVDARIACEIAIGELEKLVPAEEPQPEPVPTEEPEATSGGEGSEVTEPAPEADDTGGEAIAIPLPEAEKPAATEEPAKEGGEVTEPNSDEPADGDEPPEPEDEGEHDETEADAAGEGAEEPTERSRDQEIADAQKEHEQLSSSRMNRPMETDAEESEETTDEPTEDAADKGDEGDDTK